MKHFYGPVARALIVATAAALVLTACASQIEKAALRIEAAEHAQLRGSIDANGNAASSGR